MFKFKKVKIVLKTKYFKIIKGCEFKVLYMI